MVMPRSRSISIESSICAFMSRAATVPVIWMSRSARVDLPWSIWATMEKLRMRSSVIMGARIACPALSRKGGFSCDLRLLVADRMRKSQGAAGIT